MKVAQMLAAVREAMKYATLESMEVGSIHRHQGRGPIDPVRNEAGEIVTEANVSDFIRERLKLHHGSWIIGTLEGVAYELQAQIKHTYRASGDGTQWHHKYCVYCNELESHGSHKK